MSNWTTRTTLISIFITAAGILLGFVPFAYNTWYNIPVLTYQILPAIPLPPPLPPDLISAVIVRNTGRSPATGLGINVESEGEIIAYSSGGEERLEITTLGPKRLVIETKRLVRGTQVSLVLRTNAPVKRVSIISDQGQGQEFPGTDPAFSFLSIALIGGVLAVALVTSSLGYQFTAGFVRERPRAAAYFFDPNATPENPVGNKLIVKGRRAYHMGPRTEELVRRGKVQVEYLPGADYQLWASKQGLTIIPREPTKKEIGV